MSTSAQALAPLPTYQEFLDAVESDVQIRSLLAKLTSRADVVAVMTDMLNAFGFVRVIPWLALIPTGFTLYTSAQPEFVNMFPWTNRPPLSPWDMAGRKTWNPALPSYVTECVVPLDKFDALRRLDARLSDFPPAGLVGNV